MITNWQKIYIYSIKQSNITKRTEIGFNYAPTIIMYYIFEKDYDDFFFFFFSVTKERALVQMI